MQDQQISSLHLKLEPENPKYIAAFVGELNGNIKLIEDKFSVRIFHKGNEIKIEGDEKVIEEASNTIQNLYANCCSGIELSSDIIHAALNNKKEDLRSLKEYVIKTPRKQISPRTTNQENYLSSIDKHEINFGVGPAGTGKTYLAVAKAIEFLLLEKVDKIVLIRPAVEAGEKLGFLPGDLNQKVDPYLRPLYDALFEMLGVDKANRLFERDIIELAPLAYLRGRTLNNAFIIMDESQNTTIDQMKMFLTRTGFGSYVVVNGDMSQVDLPKNVLSGLRHAIGVLKDVDGISITEFNSKDVVRHPLVKKIIDAYADHENS